MSALVGCRECHSSHEKGVLRDFVGGRPASCGVPDSGDAFAGVFRLGPDLPLRQAERGFATFPYPGYAVLYGGNLTRYGRGGDRERVSAATLVRAIRQGISTEPDAYGRPRPLAHVMLWHFYKDMTEDDAYSIADYLKQLQYAPGPLDRGRSLIYFGDDWRAAFCQVFGQQPDESDAKLFGKPNVRQP